VTHSNIQHVIEGDRVRAFHPRTLGVIYHGTVVIAGRKYVHVDFGQLLGGVFRVAPHRHRGGSQ